MTTLKPIGSYRETTKALYDGIKFMCIEETILVIKFMFASTDLMLYLTLIKIYIYYSK